MPEKTELQRKLAKKARQLLRSRGRLIADAAICFDTTSLRILRTWDVTLSNERLSIWHHKFLVYKEVGGLAGRWMLGVAMEAAYDDLCRHMVLEDLADV